MSKAFVLLSGGIDSTTCLAIADNELNGAVEAVSFDYGQRHARELEAARAICRAQGVPHHVLNLKGIIPTNMLTDPSHSIPSARYEDLADGPSPTIVPFRNGLMLSALASFVHGRWLLEYTDEAGKVAKHAEEWYLYFGAHAEDAQRWAYPDCTGEFTGAMASAIYVGTYHQIRLRMPLQWMTKDQIIRAGMKLGVKYGLTWSCYKGGEKHCGVCPTCRARREGFIRAHIPDPTEYVGYEVAK